MTINKIDVDKNETTLSFSRHEMLLIRRALQKMSDELTEEDKWFLLEVTGIDDVMKDGNFTRLLSFHKSLIEKRSKYNEQ